MVRHELVDVVLGHDDTGDLDGLGLPGIAGRDGIEDSLKHRLAFGKSRLPDRRGHVAVLDQLHALRAAVDRYGDDVGASGLPERGDRALRRLVPAGPDRQLLVAAGRIGGQPVRRRCVAVLDLPRHHHLVVGDVDVVLALDALIECHAAVDAELAGVEGQGKQLGGCVSDLAEQVVGRVLADGHAAGRNDDAVDDLAAPCGDRNTRGLGGLEPGADGARGEGEDEDRIDLLDGEAAHRRIGLVGACLGVDHLDVPAGRVGGLGGAADHVDVERVIGKERDDAERLRVGRADSGCHRQHRCRQHSDEFPLHSSLP